jgi:hypothetical protein
MSTLTIPDLTSDPAHPELTEIFREHYRLTYAPPDFQRAVPGFPRPQGAFDFMNLSSGVMLIDYPYRVPLSNVRRHRTRYLWLIPPANIRPSRGFIFVRSRCSP